MRKAEVLLLFILCVLWGAPGKAQGVEFPNSIDISIKNTKVNNGNYQIQGGDVFEIFCEQHISHSGGNQVKNDIYYLCSTDTVPDSSDIVLGVDYSTIGGNGDTLDPEMAFVVLPDTMKGIRYIIFSADTLSAEINLTNNVSWMPIIVSPKVVVASATTTASNLWEEEDKLEIQVYPNPTIDFLNITHTQGTGEELMFEVFDLSGRLIQKFYSNEGTTSLDVRDFVEGMYVLTMTARHDGQKSSTKFFIQ